MPTPTNDAEPSFIEFLASKFKDIKLYFFAIFLTLNALCKEIVPADNKVIMVISGLIASIGWIILSYAWYKINDPNITTTTAAIKAAKLSTLHIHIEIIYFLVFES